MTVTTDLELRTQSKVNGVITILYTCTTQLNSTMLSWAASLYHAILKDTRKETCTVAS